MKRLVVLGATGSVGGHTLSIVRHFPERFTVVGLAAHSKDRLLMKQIKRFRPLAVALTDKKAAARLSQQAKPFGTEVLAGEEGVLQIARLAAGDLVVSAITGTAGLLPTLAAILANKPVALANKEAVVMAGEILMREARCRKVTILPIDSEHSALFQLLAHLKREEVKRVILTASGGPLLRYTEQRKKTVSPEEALAHPTWKMGPKISIDSATLMNKGFEMIEARWLFDLPADQIDVVIHKESIIHSLVEFCDRSLVAQMGLPDMRVPISYALFYPERAPLSFMKPPHLPRFPSLTFEAPKRGAFPLLTAAREALQTGGTMPAVLNGANEEAVSAFLARRIGFLDIHKIVRRVLAKHRPSPATTIEAILLADRWAGLEAERFIQKIAR